MLFENSPKSLFVYNDLLDQKDNINSAIDSCNENIGAATTVVNNYKVPPSALDQLALQKLSLINTKKQQIVNLLTNNYTSYSSGVGTCGIGTTITNFPSESTNIVVAGTATTFSFTRLGIGSVGTKAEVREDILSAWTFPALENIDVSNPDYTNGVNYAQVVSGNLGIGQTDVLFTDTNDPESIHANAGLIGYYYPIISGCSTITSAVTTLTNDIISLRNDINNLIVQINPIKDRKTEAQLNLWYENLSLSDYNTQLVGIQNAINAMENNSQTIIDYEATT